MAVSFGETGSITHIWQIRNSSLKIPKTSHPKPQGSHPIGSRDWLSALDGEPTFTHSIRHAQSMAARS
jgi:hypothetical protein